MSCTPCAVKFSSTMPLLPYLCDFFSDAFAKVSPKEHCHYYVQIACYKFCGYCGEHGWHSRPGWLSIWLVCASSSSLLSPVGKIGWSPSVHHGQPRTRPPAAIKRKEAKCVSFFVYFPFSIFFSWMLAPSLILHGFLPTPSPLVLSFCWKIMAPSCYVKQCNTKKWREHWLVHVEGLRHSKRPRRVLADHLTRADLLRCLRTFRREGMPMPSTKRAQHDGAWFQTMWALYKTVRHKDRHLDVRPWGNGVGLFAAKNIPKGTRLLLFGSQQAVSRDTAMYLQAQQHPSLVCTDQNTYAILHGPSSWLNHAHCHCANVQVLSAEERSAYLYGTRNSEWSVLVARRDILMHDQVCIWYGSEYHGGLRRNGVFQCPARDCSIQKAQWTRLQNGRSTARHCGIEKMAKGLFCTED